jgi:nicotinamidase-related amidase
MTNIKNKRVNAPKPPVGTALLLIDLITDFNFNDGDKLWEQTKKIIEPVWELTTRSRSLGVPVIYVNDNYGNWSEDFDAQVSRIIETSDNGRELAESIRPTEKDLYILKPQRSGFYETPLAVLLESMEIHTLMMAGITTDICVLFTAHDAYMRGFSVMVPSNCTAAVEEGHRDQALDLVERVAKADISMSHKVNPLKAAAGE